MASSEHLDALHFPGESPADDAEPDDYETALEEERARLKALQASA